MAKRYKTVVIMSGWAPIWSMIVDSSLWEEPDCVCKVFVTMLALKDHDHIVRLDSYKLAKKAHKTEQEVVEALKVLSSPDTRRIAPQEFDGRRIEKVLDGWLILNGEKYKQMMSRIHRLEYQAQWQRDYRARNPKSSNGDLTPTERISLEKQQDKFEKELARLEIDKPYPSGDARIARMKTLRVDIGKMEEKLKIPV